MKGVLDELGYSSALVARETKDGLQLVDGHLRAEITPDEEVPVVIVDLTEDEADKLLLLMDPLSAMAQSDLKRLDKLLGMVESDNRAIKEFIGSMSAPVQDKELTELALEMTPKMAWVLIGIPINDYVGISNSIDQIKEIPGVLVESTFNCEK